MALSLEEYAPFAIVGCIKITRSRESRILVIGYGSLSFFAIDSITQYLATKQGVGVDLMSKKKSFPPITFVATKVNTSKMRHNRKQTSTPQTLDKIKQEGGRYRECGLLSMVASVGELCRTLYRPEGLEFCSRNAFPSLELLEELEEHHSSEIKSEGAHINRGNIGLILNPRRLALVGDTEATIHIDSQTAVHKIVLMHGAKAHIHAKGYTVVSVTQVGEGNRLTTATDGTATILDL